MEEWNSPQKGLSSRGLGCLLNKALMATDLVKVSSFFPFIAPDFGCNEEDSKIDGAFFRGL